MFSDRRSRQTIRRSISTKSPERRIVVESGSVKTATFSAFTSAQALQVWIPNSIVILKGYSQLQFIIFESNSQLTQIESKAFSSSSLQSTAIPRTVQFINGSAFIDVTLSSISIEPGNDIFVIENDLLIDVARHKLIRNFSQLSAIEIGINIEMLESKCFSSCKSLSSILFESNSRLTRIESFAFSSRSLQSILIPSNVEILGSGCFSYCESLSSITFESNSQLTRIESEAFSSSSFRSIILPSIILFVASDAIDTFSQILNLDGDSWPEFDQWQKRRSSGITNDFR
jgi:uncharacterized protein YuzB (UPF0349 family)